MKSSISSASPFEIPHIKNARVVKTEIKPFFYNIVYTYTKPLSFENEPYSLETIPLVREHLDTYLFYIRHRSTTASTENSSFQIFFLNKEPPQFKHIEEQITQKFSKFPFTKISMHS